MFKKRLPENNHNNNITSNEKGGKEPNLPETKISHSKLPQFIAENWLFKPTICW